MLAETVESALPGKHIVKDVLFPCTEAELPATVPNTL